MEFNIPSVKSYITTAVDKSLVKAHGEGEG